MISDLVEAAGRPVFYSGFRIGVRNDGGGCASTFAEASADKAAYPPYDYWIPDPRIRSGAGLSGMTAVIELRVKNSLMPYRRADK